MKRGIPFLLTLGMACHPALRLTEDDSHRVLSRQLLDAPDPASPGAHEVGYLTYGSGTDRRRAEYRDVAVRTDAVDGSKLVDFGSRASNRRNEWGIVADSLPLNARVWYPEGEGPFPLVLIAHGNHDPEDYSDPGYEWLGRLLASRGFILASLDMNFINGLSNENDARGWLFLKHLDAWSSFDETDNPLRGLADLESVALIGHSRGGEAVGHAAAFNRLVRYPDDATVTFEFGHGIRSLVALAPVDGQYTPADRLVPVEDVNYLVLHGSHDGDVSAFMGLRQYQRVRFASGEPFFKSAVYIYRANHGQWNTVWGAHDCCGDRASRVLDLRALLSAEEQRRAGAVYIVSFLEATLRGDERYLPLFRDHRVAGEWLPKTMYVTRFEESAFSPVADFEEDIDVTTGTENGVTLLGDSLETWREEQIDLRTTNSDREGTSQHNSVVVLGWTEAPDSAPRPSPPSYTVSLHDEVAAGWGLGDGSALQFLLMPARSDSTEVGDPIDLTIEAVDAQGTAARVPLSDYGAVRPPLETWVLRRRDRERSSGVEHSELVLQTYTIPLADFVRVSGGEFRPAELRAVRFVFDRSPKGRILLDRIGFTTPPPAFLRVPFVSASGG